MTRKEMEEAMARKDKVQEAIKQEVSAIMREDLSDSRIGFVTITKVEVSLDLRHAKIFVSVLGETEQSQATFDALKRATGYVRKLLAERLRMRFVPEITFKEDKTAAYSVYIANKIDEIKKQTHQE